jgi:hypothetical protein
MLAPHEDWSRAGIEPRLNDLLNDPIVRLVMRRGKVSRADLLKIVAQAQRYLGRPTRSLNAQVRPFIGA